MAYVVRDVVTATTDGSGAATVYSSVLTGKIVSITYVKTDFSNGVDFTITAEATAEAIWAGTDVNAGTTVYPRAATHKPASAGGAGDPALYAAAGTTVYDSIRIANDRVKIVIAQGGATKTGAFHIVVE